MRGFVRCRPGGAKSSRVAIAITSFAGLPLHHAETRGRADMPLGMNREVFITCAVTGAGDTAGRSDKVPVTPTADRRRGDRGGEGRRGHRPHPCARPRDGQGRARPKTLSRGRGARPRVRHRRRPQPHRRHGRRPRARLAGEAAAARRRRAPTWPARASASSHVAELLPGNLHARLRHDEFRRGRLRDDQHAGHAEGDGGADHGARRPPGDRDFRHRPSGAGEMAGRAEADRRPGAGAALHGHSLGRARRHLVR